MFSIYSLISSYLDLCLNFLVIAQTTKITVLYSGKNDLRIRTCQRDFHIDLRTFHGTMILKLNSYLLYYNIFMGGLQLEKWPLTMKLTMTYSFL